MITYDDVIVSIRKGDEKSGQYWDDVTAQLNLSVSIKIDKHYTSNEMAIEQAKQSCRAYMMKRIYGEIRELARSNIKDLQMGMIADRYADMDTIKAVMKFAELFMKVGEEMLKKPIK